MGRSGSRVSCCRAVFDTDIYGFVLAPGSLIARRYERLTYGRFAYVSFQTATEIRYGAQLRGWGPGRMRWMAERIAEAEVVHTDDELTQVFADLSVDCHRAGHPLAQKIHAADCWVAATALKGNASERVLELREAVGAAASSTRRAVRARAEAWADDLDAGHESIMLAWKRARAGEALRRRPLRRAPGSPPTVPTSRPPTSPPCSTTSRRAPDGAGGSQETQRPRSEPGPDFPSSSEFLGRQVVVPVDTRQKQYR